jgi:hypothetical protein
LVSSTPPVKSTIPSNKKSLDPQILPTTPIFIHRSGDSLPHGPQHWVWEPPTHDAVIGEKCHEALPLIFPDLGENALILLSCNIMSTYLVHGASGCWISHQRFAWRGFVGKQWADVESAIVNYDLWTSIPLILTTSKQRNSATRKLLKRPRKPLSKEREEFLAKLGS